MPRTFNPLLGAIEFRGIHYTENTRAPASTDLWPETTVWIDTVTNNVYMCIDLTTGVATWVLLTNAGGTVTDFNTDSGTATPSAGIVTVAGGEGIDTSGSGSTVTIAGEDASETNKGILETATDLEAVAVSATNKAIVPSNLDNVFAAPPALGGTTPNTGEFTTLTADTNTGNTQTIFSIAPNTAISASQHWDGITVDGSALDPSGASASLHPIHIDMSGVSLTNDPELIGLYAEMPATHSGEAEKSGILAEGWGYAAELCSGDHDAAVRTLGPIRLDYDATALAAGETKAAIEQIIDTTGAAGGVMCGMRFSTSGGGSASSYAVCSNGASGIVEQNTGTFAAADYAWKETSGPAYTNVTTAFGSAGTDVQIFTADDDRIYIGGSAVFSQIEVLLAIQASKDIKAEFEFSIAGPGWTPFTPVDGTSGFTGNGIIAFNSGDLSGWASVAVNGQTYYWIRITRERNSLPTPPTEDTIKILAPIQYTWDSSGDLTVNELKPATDLAVQYGGTGAGTLTDHGVVLGSGTSPVSITSAGSAGQPLLSGGASADPNWGTLSVSYGGSGATTLTGVLIGNGTSAMTGNAVTQYNALVGGASNAITSIAPGATSGVPLISQGASTDPAFGTAVVAGGGTGATTLTDHGVLVGSGTGAVTALSAASDGELIIGSSTNDPSVATLTAGTGMTITNGAGSITLDAIGGAIAWTVVTGTTQAAAVNNGYICNNGAAVTVTLPDTAAVGSILRIAGMAGLTVLAQNAGETVYIGNTNTTPGVTGSLTATNAGDCLELVCIVADTDWRIISSIGNWTVA